MKRRYFVLIMIIFQLICLRGAGAEPEITLGDPSVRSTTWAEAYASILKERSSDIQNYQDYVLQIAGVSDCRPVGMRDLNGDQIPELFFIDAVDDPEYGFWVGRFWIYTADGTGVHCALTLRPEIDDLLYSRYYLAPDGLLTIWLADTEMDWLLQLRMNAGGHYSTETTLALQPDFSEETPDQYFLDGEKISAKKYQSMVSQIQSTQGELIGSLMVEDGGTGFAYTLQEAKEMLASEETIQRLLDPDGIAGTSADPAMEQLPELSFFRGSFQAGQKLAVNSAPSAKAWRGAKGKAAVASGNEIYVAGTEDDWILILYELDSGVTRVGYVDSRKIDGQYISGEVLSLGRTERVLREAVVMTDDPIRQKTTIGELKKGSKVTCLATYRGWIYVEAKVSGKTARGFISPSSLSQE